MDLDANELGSIYYSSVCYFLLAFYLVVGVIEKGFPTLPEEVKSYVAIPFSIVIIN